MEVPKRGEYNDGFRRRYYLKYLNPDDPDEARKIEEYETAYFTSPKELEKLKRVESILACEFVLGKLSEIDRESFLDIIWIGELEQKIAEARTLSIP
jgi:hypothetical protein